MAVGELKRTAIIGIQRKYVLDSFWMRGALKPDHFDLNRVRGTLIGRM